MSRGARLALSGALLALAACQAQAAPPTPSPLPSASETAAQSPAPSATLPEIAAISPTPWPTYPAPTLAPFPLSAEQLQPTAVLAAAPAATVGAPLALAPNDHFYFQRPVSSADLRNLVPSQRYGVFQETGDNTLPHLGLDIGLNSGTPILAAGGGEVVWASYGLFFRSEYYLDDPYGISVVIRHGFGHGSKELYTVYAHLREARVTVGEQVVAGQIIGLSGNTGLSSGPHLHFEVRLGGNTVYFTRNPELWIAPPEGHGVLVGRITSTQDVPLTDRLVEVRNLDDRRLYTTYTYATQIRLLPDEYYRENLVLGELPAGRYEVAVPYFGVWKRVDVEIRPGAITYFRFVGNNGYNFDLPAEPKPRNAP